MKEAHNFGQLRLRRTRKVLLAVLLGMGAVAVSAPSVAAGRPHGKPEHRPDAMLKVLMAPYLVEQLSTRTGLSPAEIAQRLEQQAMPELARDLGLQRQDMHEIFRDARQQFVAKASAVGLIDADTATHLQQLADRPPERDRDARRREDQCRD